MSEAVKILEPKALWNHFADINEIPRASKKEERIIQFMLDFGEGLGLETFKDHIGNVIIKKPASPGMENRQTVVLQSHLDMVHQKNNDTVFDFDTQGIQMIVDGDWVKADGTTLGADNGIGVASIMAVLSSDTIQHPAIEALFTIDEETGMTGALELKGGILSGSIMLNLDTEDDDELTIGCAGGIDITAKGNYPQNTTDASYITYKLNLKSCTGGHSGMDIHKGRANANKLMNRVLMALNTEFNISINSIDGGGLRNAIPRESIAYISFAPDQEASLQGKLSDFQNVLSQEYNTTDPGIELLSEAVDRMESCLEKDFQNKILMSLYACPNGIYRMSPDIEGLVQTSNNLARVLLQDGNYEIMCLTRSSVETEKSDLVNAIRASLNLAGLDVSTGGSYPGWTPKPSSEIVQLMADIYRNTFNEEPNVNACHAGLECGILGTNYPEMDMISFGPNIRGAHSPDERAQISSVQKFWKFFLLTLESIPSRN